MAGRDTPQPGPEDADGAGGALPVGKPAGRQRKRPAASAWFGSLSQLDFDIDFFERLLARKGDSVEVEIVLPDRTITNRVKVLPPGAVDEEEVKVPYVPLPVVLPEDPELVWVLARREDLPPEEASRALAAIEEEFWETKLGLKLLKDRVEKNFFEFISRVPAGALADRGLKRMFKVPEPLHTLRRLNPTGQALLKAVD
jgi:hypothetical protein